MNNRWWDIIYSQNFLLRNLEEINVMHFFYYIQEHSHHVWQVFYVDVTFCCFVPVTSTGTCPPCIQLTSPSLKRCVKSMDTWWSRGQIRTSPTCLSSATCKWSMVGPRIPRAPSTSTTLASGHSTSSVSSPSRTTWSSLPITNICATWTLSTGASYGPLLAAQTYGSSWTDNPSTAVSTNTYRTVASNFFQETCVISHYAQFDMDRFNVCLGARKITLLPLYYLQL